MAAEESTGKSSIAAVFNRAAAVYDQVGVDFFGPAGLRLVELAALAPGESVLDVGCGRGASLVPAAAAVGADGSVVGIDLAPAMIDKVNAKIAEGGLRHARAEIGDAESPNYSDDSFDAIIAGFVIFFLSDPVVAVAKYSRLLRPGGRLVMTVRLSDRREDTEIPRIVNDALLPYENEARPAPKRPRDPLGTRDGVEEVLANNGFTGVRVVDETYQARFDDPAHYWRWMWSHGARERLEKISADRLGPAREAVISALSKFARDKQLIYPIPARFVVAERA
ncbi:class I SAM-dependent methyltransferase [Streptosporangium sp. KLBMP 9127]|nr:methyltransferase domain-containing protein [Streptosporangium sp. KLBMP 9127]